jgi:hypothetical protein
MRELSTRLPHEFHVLVSPNPAFRRQRDRIAAIFFVALMGKKGSQDSSTCDINTSRRVLRPDSIATYDVVDTFPQNLST